MTMTTTIAQIPALVRQRRGLPVESDKRGDACVLGGVFGEVESGGRPREVKLRAVAYSLTLEGHLIPLAARVATPARGLGGGGGSALLLRFVTSDDGRAAPRTRNATGFACLASALPAPLLLGSGAGVAGRVLNATASSNDRAALQLFITADAGAPGPAPPAPAPAGETGVCIDHFAALVVDGADYSILSLEGKPGTALEGCDIPDFTGSGAPWIWLKRVEGEAVVATRLAPRGRIADALTPATAIVEDPRVEAARAANPSDVDRP